MRDLRLQARELVEQLSEEELVLLVAYARQLQDGHFAALTRGLESLLEDPA